MKGIVRNKIPSSQFYHSEKLMFDKNKLAETFNSYFVNIGSKLRTSIPENKTTFKNFIHYENPCLSTINLMDL